MATIFERVGSSVLITVGSEDPIGAAAGSFVKPDPRNTDIIVISEKANPQLENEGIRVKVSDVSTPANTGRADLITKLMTDFFFRVSTPSSALATDYFYLKSEVDAFKTPSNFLEALTAFGTSIKALPMGTAAYGFMNGGSATLVDGSVYYIAFYIPKAIISTGINFVLSTAGNYTADNYNGFGLFSVSGGTYTKITETATDGNIWKTSAYALGSKAWPTPQTLQPGVYIVALQWNASATTTAPILYSMCPISANHGLVLTNSNKISSYQTSQAALPATTVAASALTVSSVIHGIWMY